MKREQQFAGHAQVVTHVTVLLNEAVSLLEPRPGRVYVDGTVGGGGHAELILERSAPDGVLIGLDKDPEALVACMERLKKFGSRAILRQADFRNMRAVVQELGYAEADGVLLDLGMSWFQIRSAERGFSFMSKGQLDMRMDPGQQKTAADIVNTLSREDLARLIREYGEERWAGRIAQAIIRARADRPITTTDELAGIIERAYPPGPRRIHPATRTFQALRIAVNDELGALKQGLAEGIEILRPGGRIAVISFHSLEDRIVKRTFAEGMRPCKCPPRMPVCRCGRRPVLRPLTKKPVVPSGSEVERNPAARSAKLRAAEKL